MFKKNKFFSFLITFLMVFNLLIPMGSVFANSENTLTVAEAIANNSGSGTVEGYIVGTTQTQSALGSGVFEGPFTVTTNVLIADNPDERDMSKIMPVQLPNNAIRTAVNLVDHPDNLGKKIKVTGDLAAYFSVPGLRNLTGYQFVASGPIDEDPIDRDYITVAEAILNNSGNAVVEGYIVGTTQTSSVIGNGNFDGPFTIRTNLLIADSPDERDITKVLPVQLPNNEIRTATNLVDHPDHLGKKIRFTGTLEAYFGVAGLKTLTAYEFQEEVRDYVTVAEAIENNTGNATVLGYIVGTRNVFDGPFTVNTNIQIADSPFERDLAKTLPIQLPIGNVRNGLNLVDHPDNLGKLVKITGDLSAYFSAPGLRNASAYEFVDGGEVPTPEIPTVTIAEARNMMGRIVITEGIVNVDNGLLQPGRLSVYIQDGDAGIQLFNYSAGIFPEIKEGDSVKVQGRVGEYNGVTQIVVDELTLQERGQVVEIKEVTIAEYVDRNVAEAYEGQLVTLEGYIFTVPSYDNGGVNITIVDEDLNVLIIRAWESTGIDLSQIEANKWYEITAISSEYRGTYQILPRSNADFVVSAVQKDKPFGSGKEIRATVERVVDGDTIRLVDPVFGARNVRYLNIDTLETYHTVRNELDENQMMHGLRAGEYLRTMLSDGDEVILKLGDEPLDGYGRLLAEVFTLDGINTNYEMVLAGHAVTYFIWPFEDDAVLHYGEALQIEGSEG